MDEEKGVWLFHVSGLSQFPDNLYGSGQDLFITRISPDQKPTF